MARLSEYFQYNDSSLIIWRDGTDLDPYVDKSDTLKIVNNRAVLDEIPDPTSKVKINGMIEIDTRVYNAPKTPSENQYIVNYSNGIITFHNSLNGQDKVAIYKSRGKILIPANRIWLKHPNPYTVDNLQEFVELCEAKIADVNFAIGQAELATENANNVAMYANTQGDYAKEQGDRVNSLITQGESVIAEANQVISDGYIAIDEVNQATQDAIFARNQTILIWKLPVNTYTGLMAEYPTPETGWTSLIQESGIVYRYDGAEWKPLGNMTLSIPLASESVDGLLSVVDFLKLRNIEANAQVNFTGEDAKDVLPDYFKTKTIVFVAPSMVRIGEQGIIIKFPYSGNIVGVSASCEIEGSDDSEIDILKISELDFKNKNSWSSIFNQKLFIGYGERTDDESYTLQSPLVNQGDFFKLNITRLGDGLSNLVVEVVVQI